LTRKIFEFDHEYANWFLSRWECANWFWKHVNSKAREFEYPNSEINMRFG